MTDALCDVTAYGYPCQEPAEPKHDVHGGTYPTRWCPRCKTWQAEPHWTRTDWQRGGWCNPCRNAYVKARRIPLTKPCGVDGCTVMVRLTPGYCTHHIEPRRTRPLGPIEAFAAYRTAHNKVTRERGKASAHQCADGCGRIASDWAYDGTDPSEVPTPSGPYSTDADRYRPLCRSCHARQDRALPCLGNLGGPQHRRRSCAECKRLAKRGV